jgi:hypothetical protein
MIQTAFRTGVLRQNIAFCAMLGFFILLDQGCEPNNTTESFTADSPAAIRRAALQEVDQPELSRLATYRGEGGFNKKAAEIVAFNAKNQKIFIANVAMRRIDVVDIADPSAPKPCHPIDVSLFGDGPSSVAVSTRGIVAAAIVAKNPQEPGTLAFYNGDGVLLASVTVGADPDMVTFTPNGQYALVANEGEPNDDYSIDPEGSISIIDLRRGAAKVSQDDVATADFHAFDSVELDPSVRVYGPRASVSQDLEPEYIAVADNSKTAWVTLQENNAVAIVDVTRAKVLDVVGLGFKDHSLAGNGIDASDKDKAINIANYPVFGVYMPDGIDAFRTLGRDFIITANEGDARNYKAFAEEKRCGKLKLDPTVFPNAAELQSDQAVGRLQCSIPFGDIDGDGDYDALYAFGARSFSIWTSRGQLVYDSGDDLEQITAKYLPDEFNSNDTENGSFDSRSDNSGPEPESVVVGEVRGRYYAFIALERVGGIVVYDVTVPYAPRFVQYINTRDFGGDPVAGTAGDLSPEGMVFIPASISPIRSPLLVVSFPVSGTTTLYQFK